jgi:hypothetical protein
MTKECSAKEGRIKEAIDTILLTAMEPYKGLTEEGLENAKKNKGPSEFWSMSGTAPLLAILALIGSGLAAFLYISKSGFTFPKSVSK